MTDRLTLQTDVKPFKHISTFLQRFLMDCLQYLHGNDSPPKLHPLLFGTIGRPSSSSLCEQYCYFQHEIFLSVNGCILNVRVSDEKNDYFLITTERLDIENLSGREPIVSKLSCLNMHCVGFQDRTNTTYTHL